MCLSPGFSAVATSRARKASDDCNHRAITVDYMSPNQSDGCRTKAMDARLREKGRLSFLFPGLMRVFLTTVFMVFFPPNSHANVSVLQKSRSTHSRANPAFWLLGPTAPPPHVHGYRDISWLTSASTMRSPYGYMPYHRVNGSYETVTERPRV